jgi:hypothetical protein
MTSPSEPLTSATGTDPAGPPVLPQTSPAQLTPSQQAQQPAGGPPDQPSRLEPIFGADAPAPAEKKQSGRGKRLVSLVLLIVMAIAGIAGGGFALVHEMTRHATKAEIAAAGAKELASRWQRLPAGKIFPATISYQDAQDQPVPARLVGIAPPVSCGSAMTAAAFARIRPFGCSTVLRATYIDASGTLAATVGVAVLASQTAATGAQARLGSMTAGVSLDAVPFSGTVTNDFGNAQRAVGAIQMTGGPYLFLFSAGDTVGVPASVARANPELAPLGGGVLSSLESTLTSMGNPCAMKDVRC